MPKQTAERADGAPKKEPIVFGPEPPPELPAPAGEVAEPRRRLRLPALPRFSDDRQRRAGANVLRFLALVLILTLVARGTAGATLAKVDVASPNAGDIVEQVRATAHVKAGDSTGVEAPAGLTIKEMLAGGGQKLAEGDPVARFDPAEVAEKLARETAALQELQLKLRQLEKGETYDGSALSKAQRDLEWAQQDYDNGIAAAGRTVTDAEAALVAARNNQTVAQAEWDNLPADATEEQRAAAQAKLDDANATVPRCETAVSDAKTELERQKQSLGRALETARQGLANQQKADAEGRQQVADKNAENQVTAATVRLDIAAQQKKVDALKKLDEAGGVLHAPAGGTVLETAAEGSETAATPIAKLANAKGGYEAEATLTKEQAKKLAVGDACDVRSGGSMYYNNIVPGTITALSAPDENGNVTATIRLPEGEWKQGQNVEVNITQSRQNYGTVVPLSALHSDNNSYYILMTEQQTTVLGVENVVVQIPVELVAKDDKNAAIEGPIPYDGKVITNSSKALEAGNRVRVNGA